MLKPTKQSCFLLILSSFNFLQHYPFWNILHSMLHLFSSKKPYLFFVPFWICVMILLSLLGVRDAGNVFVVLVVPDCSSVIAPCWDSCMLAVARVLVSLTASCGGCRFSRASVCAYGPLAYCDPSVLAQAMNFPATFLPNSTPAALSIW